MDIIIAHMEMMKKIVVKNNKLTYKCNTSYMARAIFMLYIHLMYKGCNLDSQGSTYQVNNELTTVQSKPKLTLASILVSSPLRCAYCRTVSGMVLTYWNFLVVNNFLSLAQVLSFS